MSKIHLIIAREYFTKIRSRTFILLTVLGPILYLAIIFGSVFIAKFAQSGNSELLLVDKSGLFIDDFLLDNKFTAHYKDMDLAEVERAFAQEGWETPILYIPEQIAENHTGAVLYYAENPGVSVIDHARDIMNHRLRDLGMRQAGIDQALAEKIMGIEVDLQSKTVTPGGVGGGSIKVAAGLAFGSAFLLYFFIFLYGSMVLRGVQEEKTSRISEVIISSVRPFELMMGKIVGNALLGFTQFAIWVVLAALGSALVASLLPFQAQDMLGSLPANPASLPTGTGASAISMALQAGSDFNIFETILYFILFFIGGYMLYSSLFAAIAAAVDGQQDLQQFMFPITVPMILGIIVMPSVIESPNNPLAVFFSLFPFTSPIVMMARIPFGVVWWQKVLSLVLLAATFIGAVYVSGKIYRVGLLSYGAKPSWKQMFKWLTYKS
jgi:ABC-2 type transport system permease protein